MTRANADVRPFPHAALDVLTREDLALRRRLAETTRDLVDAPAFVASLETLIGVPVRAMLRRLGALDVGATDPAAIAFVLAPAPTSQARRQPRRVLVELEGALAAALAARALSRDAPRFATPGHATGPHLAGAAAAIAIAAARRANDRPPPRLVTAGPAPVLAREIEHGAGSVVSATLTVIVGDDAYDARISFVFAESSAVIPARTPSAAFSHADLATLGEAPLALEIVATTCIASRADVALLAPGDAFMLPGFPLQSTSDGLLVGPVALVAAKAERGLSAALAEGGQLVVRGQLEPHSWDAPTAARTPMPSENDNPTLEAVVALEDAPVVVRVELGAVEMSARAWSELAAGDVIALGRKLGEPAVLRAGGVEIARGELVVVDGEYGVRILSTARAKEAP